jgi:hypothetical protein
MTGNQPADPEDQALRPSGPRRRRRESSRNPPHKLSAVTISAGPRELQKRPFPQRSGVKL